jgi:CheY-like chemotaxis protein
MTENLFLGKSILVVDDEIDLREIIASEFQYLGADVFVAGSILVAQDILKDQKIDLVISDIRMPGGSGVELLDFVKKNPNSKTAMILISGFADFSIQEALIKGVDGYISKPFQLDDIISSASKCLNN